MKQMFLDSCKELTEVKTLVISAMLMAVAVVLGFFSIMITDSIRVGFSFICNEMGAMLFGPVVGGVIAAGADILKYLMKPMGPFHPGFTISALLGGVIYGIILYRKPMTVKRLLAAKVIVSLFVNAILNTFWLSAMLGKGFFVLLPARLVLQLTMIPIEVVLFYMVAKSLIKAGVIRDGKRVNSVVK